MSIGRTDCEVEVIHHNKITDLFTKVIFIPLYVNNQIPINEHFSYETQNSGAHPDTEGKYN